MANSATSIPAGTLVIEWPLTAWSVATGMGYCVGQRIRTGDKMRFIK